MPDSFERLARAGQHLVPIGRVASVFDERVAERDWLLQLLEQVRVKNPPEAVIDPATLHLLVKFKLGLTFQRLPAFERGMEFNGKRSQNLLPVGKKQGVADIEKHNAPLSHPVILLPVFFPKYLLERVSEGFRREIRCQRP